MENTDLRDRALLVLAEIELEYDRAGQVAEELVAAAVLRHATGREDSWDLWDAVRGEMGLEAAPRPRGSLRWALWFALGFAAWLLVLVAFDWLTRGMV